MTGVVSITTITQNEKGRFLLPAKNGWVFELDADEDNESNVFLFDTRSKAWSWFTREDASLRKVPHLRPEVVYVEVLGVKVGVITLERQWYHEAAAIIDDYFGVYTERISTDEWVRYKRDYTKHPYKKLFSYFPNYCYIYRPKLSLEELEAEEKEIDKKEIRRQAFNQIEVLNKYVDKETRLIYKLGREALIDQELSKSLER